MTQNKTISEATDRELILELLSRGKHGTSYPCQYSGESAEMEDGSILVRQDDGFDFEILFCDWITDRSEDRDKFLGVRKC